MSLLSAIRRMVGGRSEPVADLLRASSLPEGGLAAGARRVGPPPGPARVQDQGAAAPPRPDRAYHRPRGGRVRPDDID